MKKVRIIIPEEQAPAAGQSAARRAASSGALRLGVLDNSKSNADHLLRCIADGVRGRVSVANIVALRKPSASRPAEEAVLAQLEAEADFVVSAMAD